MSERKRAIQLAEKLLLVGICAKKVRVVTTRTKGNGNQSDSNNNWERESERERGLISVWEFDVRIL